MIRRLSAAGFAMSVAIVLLAFGMLFALNCLRCGYGELMLKTAVPLAVLAVHRTCRARGRSVFFAAGLLLAASVLLFSVFRLQPFTLYL